MKFLEDYYIYRKNKGEINKIIRVYTIVNCGFPEPKINTEAIRVIKNFFKRLNLNWRFGIGIGMGEFVGTTKVLPKSLRMPINNQQLNLPHFLLKVLSKEGITLHLVRQILL